jgi:outer membrane lipoprotein-sorting protein
MGTGCFWNRYLVDRFQHPKHGKSLTLGQTNGQVDEVKQRLIIAALVMAAAIAGYGQDILTADQFMRQLSARYSEIKDYVSDLEVIAGQQRMTGTVLYKAPNLMRVDFSQPAEQVIVYDGSILTVYVPELRAKLTQSTSTTASPSSASGEGLRMLTRSYSSVYATGPTPVALPGTQQVMVIRLVLSRLTVAEGFRTIILSVDPETMLIRQLEGTTLAGDIITYNYTNTRINQGLADSRFIYDSPATANTYHNFLFSSDN